MNYSHKNKDVDEALDLFEFCMKKTKKKFNL